MTFLRGMGHSRSDGSERAVGAAGAHQEERRIANSGRLGVATLACQRCDAPVAIGAQPLAVSHRLTCPFCLHTAPLRDFLSLASPVRPARVVIRVGQRRRAVR